MTVTDKGDLKQFFTNAKGAGGLFKLDAAQKAKYKQQTGTDDVLKIGSRTSGITPGDLAALDHLYSLAAAVKGRIADPARVCP